MNNSPGWMCLWPGLPQLWRHGSLPGLGVAFGFALLLNATLLTTFVWSHELSANLLRSVWVTLSGTWIATSWWTWKQDCLMIQVKQEESVAAGELFVEAQHEYLQAHWFEAESLLERLLRQHPEDVEGRLLLATLYRHTSRLEEASEQLQTLEQMEGVERWRLGLISERRLLQQQSAEQQEVEATQDS